MEEAFQNLSISEESFIASPRRRAAEATLNSVSDMNDAEKETHLRLCMKLSAENKINAKNAFGLHLIGLMPLFLKDKTDLQAASLSLQASSKIYGGRVDALYQQTFKFHNELQTMVSGKKIAEPEVAGELSEENTNKKKRNDNQNKIFKSYIGSEESITVATNTCNNLKPHGNFQLVKSAFMGTDGKKLMNCIQCEGDSNEIKCASPSYIFKPKQPPQNVLKYTLSKKNKGIIENMSKREFVISDIQTDVGHFGNVSLFQGNSPIQNDADLSFAPTSPQINADVQMPMNETDNSVFFHNSGPVNDNPEDEFHALTEKMSFFDITADIFVNDITQAVANEKKEPKKRVPKSKPTDEEVKEYEPFFATLDVDGGIFMVEKETPANISTWSLEHTTDIGSAFNKFSDLLENSAENENDTFNTEEPNLLYTHFAFSNNKYLRLKYSFFKGQELWKPCLDIQEPSIKATGRVRPDISDIYHRHTDTDTSVDIIQSLEHLSLKDSFQDDCGTEALPSYDEPCNNSFFSHNNDNLQNLLVVPPELVKPINVRVQQQAMNIDTGRVKSSLWGILSTHFSEKSETLFSSVYNDIEKELGSSQSISWQFIFVMLLVLSNEKCLLLENIDDTSDLLIKQDS